MGEQQEKIGLEKKSYLVLSIKNTFYAINALNVQEIMELPALQSVGGMPSYIAGFLNMRNEVVVVLDLRICLGSHFKNYSPLDHLIIVRGEKFSFGLVVSESPNLMPLEIQSAPSEIISMEVAPLFPFINNIAKLQEEIVFIIDTVLLEKYTLQASPEIFKPGLKVTLENEAFNTPTNLIEQKIFQDRATKLALKATVFHQHEELTLLMIILLKKEFYAIETIQEFCSFKEFTPVPFAPPYVFGFFNLRGYVLPVIDIWQLLRGIKNEMSETSKLLVVDFEGKAVGVLVDDVVDIIYSDAESYRTVPLSLKVDEAFVKSTIKYQKKVIPILDVFKILKTVQPQPKKEVNLAKIT